MENQEKKSWGGKRREGRTQTPKPFRIENDLVAVFPQLANVNGFVNQAIREKMIRENLLKEGSVEQGD